MDMQPRIREVIGFLDEQRAGLWQSIDAVPSALHEQQPETGWSIAHIVEHLGLVEEGIAERVASAVAARRMDGLGPETSTESVLGVFDVTRFLDRSQRRTAPEALHPRGGLGMASARSRLEDVRRTLREMILSCDGLAVGEVKLPHPRLGEMNVYEWMLFLGAHEGRHAAQIRAVAASLLAKQP
jgi:hypothetical protein